MDTSSGYPQPSFVEGMILQAKSSKMVQGTSYYKTGERMVAWYGGKNMGSVTQWLYPSNNGHLADNSQLDQAGDGWIKLGYFQIILDVNPN